MAHATTPISHALSRALRAAADVIADAIAPAAAGDGRAIRRLRIASRRLRETVAVVRAATGARPPARLARDARRLSRALAPVRDADVALAALDRRARGGSGWPAVAVATMRRRLAAARERRLADLGAALAAIDVRAIADRAAALADEVAADARADRWPRALAMRVARRAIAADAALARLGTLYAPDRLHALRVAVKKLRYALELADGVREADDVRRVLKHAQRVLGRVQDLQALAGEVRAAADAAGRASPGAALDRLGRAIERRCRERHAETLAGVPALRAAIAAARRPVVAALGAGRPAMAKAPAAAGRRRVRPPARPRAVAAMGGAHR